MYTALTGIQSTPWMVASRSYPRCSSQWVDDDLVHEIYGLSAGNLTQTTSFHRCCRSCLLEGRTMKYLANWLNFWDMMKLIWSCKFLTIDLQLWRRWGHNSSASVNPFTLEVAQQPWQSSRLHSICWKRQSTRSWVKKKQVIHRAAVTYMFWCMCNRWYTYVISRSCPSADAGTIWRQRIPSIVHWRRGIFIRSCPFKTSFCFQQPTAEVLPHVYTSSSMSQGNVVSQFGSKYMLPLGTTRQTHEVRFLNPLHYQCVYAFDRNTKRLSFRQQKQCHLL